MKTGVSPATGDGGNAIKAVRDWIDLAVIGLDLCPFARRVRDSQRIDCVVVTGSRSTVVEALRSRFEYLDICGPENTSLLILTDGYENFDHYLAALDDCQSALIEDGREGQFQLASFHPDYCFDGAGEDDVENYTNRSPYPVIQILNESGVEQALTSFRDPEDIPQRNMEKMRATGLARMVDILARCRR